MFTNKSLRTLCQLFAKDFLSMPGGTLFAVDTLTSGEFILQGSGYTEFKPDFLTLVTTLNTSIFEIEVYEDTNKNLWVWEVPNPSTIELANSLKGKTIQEIETDITDLEKNEIRLSYEIIKHISNSAVYTAVVHVHCKVVRKIFLLREILANKKEERKKS